MNSRVIDLTGDSSDVERAKAPEATMPRPKQQPLKAVKNGSRIKKQATPKPVISAALKKAIDTMDPIRLRALMKHYCETIEPLRKDFEKSLLVPGKEVVRYHADSDSEDDKDSESESTEDEDGSDGDEDGDSKKRLKPIAVADDEMVPRYASCLNCGITDFDVTANDRGDCRWHPGQKEPYYDDDFWADHDERCHGDIDALVDEPDYADGFRWSCCDEPGDDTGCKSTKHKTGVNQIQW